MGRLPTVPRSMGCATCNGKMPALSRRAMGHCGSIWVPTNSRWAPCVSPCTCALRVRHGATSPRRTSSRVPISERSGWPPAFPPPRPAHSQPPLQPIPSRISRPQLPARPHACYICTYMPMTGNQGGDRAGVSRSKDSMCKVASALGSCRESLLRVQPSNLLESAPGSPPCLVTTYSSLPGASGLREARHASRGTRASLTLWPRQALCPG